MLLLSDLKWEAEDSGAASLGSDPGPATCQPRNLVQVIELP